MNFQMDMTGLVPYNVNYEDRHDAKKRGMRWNPDLRLWVGKPGLPYPLVRPIFFLLEQNWPNALPGEDRTFGNTTLVPEPLPTSLHGENFRTTLGDGEWGLIRRYVFSRAKGICEICGSPSGDECHETFSFDFSQGEARIIRLQALCCDCHASIHWAFTQITQPYEVVEELYKRMERMSIQRGKNFEVEMKNSIKQFEIKEKIEWKFNPAFFEVKI